MSDTRSHGRQPPSSRTSRAFVPHVSQDMEKLIAKYKDAKTQREKAQIEAKLWEYAGSDIRRDVLRREYLHKLVGGKIAEFEYRGSILKAEWAEPLWARIETDMPLVTAVKLVRKARKAGNSSGKFYDAFQTVLTAYDKTPAIDLERADGKIVRRKRTSNRPPVHDEDAWKNIRDGALAIAGVGLDKVPEHLRAGLLKDFETELKTLVHQFQNRVRGYKYSGDNNDDRVPPARVRSACLVFGIAPPSPGKPVDIKKAKQAQKRLVRVYHPDINPNTRQQFEQVIEAYETLERYMSTINGGERRL